MRGHLDIWNMYHIYIYIISYEWSTCLLCTVHASLCEVPSLLRLFCVCELVVSCLDINWACWSWYWLILSTLCLYLWVCFSPIMDETGWKFAPKRKHGRPEPIQLQLAPSSAAASMFKLEKLQNQRSTKYVWEQMERSRGPMHRLDCSPRTGQPSLNHSDEVKEPSYFRQIRIGVKMKKIWNHQLDL